MTDKKDTMITIDLETTIKNDIGKGNRPSPFSPKNRIVAYGRKYLKLNNPEPKHYCADYTSEWISPETFRACRRIVGHNLKFDLHYLRKKGLDNLHKYDVWDTQLAEYILSGQQDKFPKLDDVAVRYEGGTHKIDEVKQMWDAGIQTEDIDEDLLMEYLEGDVKNTELVALGQMQRCMDEGILPFVETQMDAVLAVEEMEYNGMHVDTIKLAELRKNLSEKLEALSHHIIVAFHTAHSPLAHHPELIDINSPKKLSTLLFGGTLKYKVKEKVGVYKNGNDKFKQIEHEIHLDPLYSARSDWNTKTGISTSDSVLEELAKKDTLGIAKRLQEFRGVSKELSTYVVSLGDLIYPDGKLHGSLHQTSTSTGRLSSAQPNLQNMPSGGDSEIKTMFTSRWGLGGRIIEADYSQLEVICLAFLSGDKRLMDDILTGKDMHKETGKLVFSGLTKDQRRIVKTINFGLIYGGKAGTLSKQANVTKELAQKCIDAFYTRYPRVKEWQEDTFKGVVANRVFEGGVSAKGFPSGVSHYKSITGRKYVFKQYDKPDWMTWEKDMTVFSPQETRNYPVQGFATADIVPMMVGILFKVLKNNPLLKDDCLMINTVHDSIIFDCKEEVSIKAMNVIKETLEDAPRYIKEKLGIDFNLPLKAEVSIGFNWKEQKEVDISIY